MLPGRSILSPYEQRRAYEAQQLAIAREAAKRQARYFKDLKTDSSRLVAANQALSDGDIDAACRLYVRIAASKSATPWKSEAQKRLDELTKKAQTEFSDIESRLADLRSTSPSEQADAEATRRLLECIADYDNIAGRYARIPKVGAEMKSKLAMHKRRPEVQAGLREPEASLLWKEGQQLETDGSVCCAFLVYEKAVKELPAPSARLAEQRLLELKADPTQVKAAEDCRRMQWCHRRYRLAERIAKIQPAKARELFQEIVERSPASSKIHQEAIREINILKYR